MSKENIPANEVLKHEPPPSVPAGSYYHPEMVAKLVGMYPVDDVPRINSGNPFSEQHPPYDPAMVRELTRLFPESI